MVFVRTGNFSGSYHLFFRYGNDFHSIFQHFSDDFIHILFCIVLYRKYLILVFYSVAAF